MVSGIELLLESRRVAVVPVVFSILSVCVTPSVPMCTVFSLVKPANGVVFCTIASFEVEASSGVLDFVDHPDVTVSVE